MNHKMSKVWQPNKNTLVCLKIVCFCIHNIKKSKYENSKKEGKNTCFSTQGFQIKCIRINIKKREIDQKLTGLNNKKKLFFKTCQKLCNNTIIFQLKTQTKTKRNGRLIVRPMGFRGGLNWLLHQNCTYTKRRAKKHHSNNSSNSVVV